MAPRGYEVVSGRISTDEMVEMRQLGMRIDDIAKAAELPYATVATRLRRRDVRPEAPVLVKDYANGPSHADYELIRRLYWDDEMSEGEIAEHLGISPATVHERMVHGFIPRRTRTQAISLGNRRRYSRTAA